MMTNVMVTTAGPGGMPDELRHAAWPASGPNPHLAARLEPHTAVCSDWHGLSARCAVVPGALLNAYRLACSLCVCKPKASPMQNMGSNGSILQAWEARKAYQHVLLWPLHVRPQSRTL